jgi:hypothetical protein
VLTDWNEKSFRKGRQPFKGLIIYVFKYREVQYGPTWRAHLGKRARTKSLQNLAEQEKPRQKWRGFLSTVSFFDKLKTSCLAA